MVWKQSSHDFVKEIRHSPLNCCRSIQITECETTTFSRHTIKKWHAYNRADYRFASSQWETALLCKDVSRWLGTNLESVLLQRKTVLGVSHHLDTYLLYNSDCDQDSNLGRNPLSNIQCRLTNHRLSWWLCVERDQFTDTNIPQDAEKNKRNP